MNFLTNMWTKEQKSEFATQLVNWYKQEKRDLPWRKTTNPYYIWISEVMLQQTRVDTVIPYYERFIKKYPTMEDLARAKEGDLLKMWEGLGYYSRARNLQRGVKKVLTTYGGHIPTNRQDILTLQGVGPYTAGAILSIAFGLPEHAVDGNVMRVLSRIFVVQEDIAIAKTKRIFETIVSELIQYENPSFFNQGLMELGATICTVKPTCLLCPVMDFCGAFQEGMTEQLPVKTKRKKGKSIKVAFVAIQNDKGEWLLKKRPDQGLLANLWEFPFIEMNQRKPVDKLLFEQERIQVKELMALKKFKHAFTHLTWDVAGYIAKIDDTSGFSGDYQFFNEEKVESLPKPVAVVKIWDKIKERRERSEG